MHGSMIDADQAAFMERINQARRELMQIAEVSDLKRLRDHSERLRADAQHRDLGLELQNNAAELKLQTERKLGASLAQMKLRGGDRKTGRELIRLKDLGIDKNQSARWQQAASVPDEVFCDYVRKTRAAGKEISSAALLRLAKQWRLCHQPSNEISNDNDRPSLSSYQQLGYRDVGHSLPQTLEVHELVDEGKNHVNTLTGLLEQLCERAGLEPESGERRACRRYLTEISLHFDHVLTEMKRLSNEHRFLTSAIPA